MIALPTKVVIIGTEKSGKTCFSTLLEKEESLKSRLNIFDLAREEVDNQIFQLLITPKSLCVLVITNNRTESYTEIEPWLRKISLIAGKNEDRLNILLINNVMDKSYIIQPDFEKHLDLYKETLSLYPLTIDLHKDPKSICIEKIEEILSKPSMQLSSRESEKSFEIYKDITDEYENYLRHCDFEDICKKHNVHKISEQRVISQELHNSGYISHFINDISLCEIIILNHGWINLAIDKIMNNSKIFLKNGVFNDSELNDLWPEYSIYERGKLLEIIINPKFEIFYNLQDGNKYLNPKNFNLVKPDYSWRKDEKNYRKRLEFTNDPIGIIERIFIKNHQKILKDQDNNAYVWKNGIVLQEEGAQVQLIKSYDGKHVIDIESFGTLESSKHLLEEIFRNIKDIQVKYLPDSHIFVLFPCICCMCNPTNIDTVFFKTDDINHHKKNNKDSIYCENCHEKVDIATLTGSYLNQLTTPASDVKAIANTRTNNDKDITWYKQWWIYAVVVSVAVLGMIKFEYLKLDMKSVMTVTVIGLIFYIFKPKRRYYHLGLMFSLVFVSIASPPFLSGYIKSKQSITSNQFIEFAIKAGEDMDPLYAGIMAIAALISAFVSFNMDKKQN